jgi:hypothetical protein
MSRRGPRSGEMHARFKALFQGRTHAFMPYCVRHSMLPGPRVDEGSHDLVA